MAACRPWIQYKQQEENRGISFPALITSSSHAMPLSGKVSTTSIPESSQGKRKFPPEFEDADSRSRPRLDGPQPQYNYWGPRQNENRRESGDASQPVGDWPPQHQGKIEPVTPDPFTHQRLSNLRTPVGYDAHETSQWNRDLSTRRAPGNAPDIGTGQIPPIVQQQGNPIMPSQHPQYQEAPRISLDLNALSAGREIDGLPFSGYDFLSGDVYALLGSVFRPQNEQLPPHYEENSQMLWQAYDQAGSHFGQE